jgi:hypothetical protein
MSPFYSGLIFHPRAASMQVSMGKHSGKKTRSGAVKKWYMEWPLFFAEKQLLQTDNS